MNQNHNTQSELKKNVGCFFGLCQAMAYLAEAWLRRPGTVGTSYFGGQAAIGLGILLVIAAFSRSPILLQFWLATAGMMAVHYFAGLRRDRRGMRVHSRSMGRSALASLAGNRAAYLVLEPLVTFAIGWLLIRCGYGYGGGLVWLSIAMFFSAAYTEAEHSSRMRSMHDARFDQEWMIEQFHR